MTEQHGFTATLLLPSISAEIERSVRTKLLNLGLDIIATHTTGEKGLVIISCEPEQFGQVFNTTVERVPIQREAGALTPAHFRLVHPATIPAELQEAGVEDATVLPPATLWP